MDKEGTHVDRLWSALAPEMREAVYLDLAEAIAEIEADARDVRRLEDLAMPSGICVSACATLKRSEESIRAYKIAMQVLTSRIVCTVDQGA